MIKILDKINELERHNWIAYMEITNVLKKRRDTVIHSDNLADFIDTINYCLEMSHVSNVIVDNRNKYCKEYEYNRIVFWIDFQQDKKHPNAYIYCKVKFDNHYQVVMRITKYDVEFKYSDGTSEDVYASLDSFTMNPFEKTPLIRCGNNSDYYYISRFSTYEKQCSSFLDKKEMETVFDLVERHVSEYAQFALDLLERDINVALAFKRLNEQEK